MKVVFSRKGFDTKAGGRPSPVVDGRPISLPIPAVRAETTSYSELGLGTVVEQITGGRVRANDRCHRDPFFADGHCALGQIGAAQTHLANQGVGAGDLFLFFGLFQGQGRPHHRIFGYLAVERVIALGPEPCFADPPSWLCGHPHLSGRWPANNTLYLGTGRSARTAPDLLRLTAGPGASRWHVPGWLSRAGLSYHRDPTRWQNAGFLDTVAQGQEFVTDPGEDVEARRWLAEMVDAIAAGP